MGLGSAPARQVGVVVVERIAASQLGGSRWLGLRSWAWVLGDCRLRSNLDPGPEGPGLNRPKRLVAAEGLSTGACHDDTSQCC